MRGGLDGAPATAAPRRGGPAGGDFLAAAEHAVPRRRAGGRLVLGRGGGRRGRGDLIYYGVQVRF